MTRDQVIKISKSSFNAGVQTVIDFIISALKEMEMDLKKMTAEELASLLIATLEEANARNKTDAH